MTDLISFDYAMKYLVKDKANHFVIESFLNALLSVHTRKQEHIKIISLLDSESLKESWEKKFSVADLLVEDSKGEKFIIEIERGFDNTIIHKACFNTSRTIVDNVPKGNNKLSYLEIKKVYHISLLYFALKSGGTLYHGKTVIKEVEKDHPLDLTIRHPKTNEVIEAHNVLPEYYFISIPNFDDTVQLALDEWLFLLKNKKIKKEFHSPGIMEAAERLKYINLSPEEQAKYDKYLLDAASAQYKLDSNYMEGKEEGEEIGYSEKTKQVVLNMLKENMDYSIISKIAEVDLSYVERLSKDLNN